MPTPTTEAACDAPSGDSSSSCAAARDEVSASATQAPARANTRYETRSMWAVGSWSGTASVDRWIRYPRDDETQLRLVDCIRVFDRSDCHTWLVSTLMKKRTKHGHSRQSTDRSAAEGSELLRGNQESCFCRTHAAEATSSQRVTRSTSAARSPVPRAADCGGIA